MYSSEKEDKVDLYVMWLVNQRTTPVTKHSLPAHVARPDPQTAASAKSVNGATASMARARTRRQQYRSRSCIVISAYTSCPRRFNYVSTG